MSESISYLVFLLGETLGNHISVSCLHAFAPRTVHSHLDVVIPEVSECSLIAEFARDHLRSCEWVASDDAWLMVSSAVRAAKTSFINFVAALFAVSGRKGLINAVVHVYIQNPITDVVPFISTYQVLIRKRNLER